MRLELTIERVVLEGYSGADAAGLDARVGAEVQALFERHGIPAGLGDRPELPAMSLGGAPPAGGGADGLARAVASSVYRALGGHIE